jgi:hypothetical protein
VKKVVIHDGGEFTDRRGIRSAARLYSVLRTFEASGRIRIENIHYIESMQSQPLPFESPDESRAVRIRDERRRAVQRDRVSKTSQFLLGKDSLECATATATATATADLIVIILKPDDDNGRNDRIFDALTSEAKVIIFPPYFSSLKALKDLKGRVTQQKDIERLFMWLPYRFSEGVLTAQKEAKEEDDEIAAITINVMAGPYPRKAFVHEFIMPFFDFLPVLGGPIAQLRVIESSPMGLPVFGFQAVHAPSTISSGLFTSAGGSFQNISHANVSIYSTGLWSLNLSGASLNEMLKRSPISHEVRGTASHDAEPNVLNGSHGLLDRILRENWVVGDEAKKPTLPNVLHIQELIDSFLREEPPPANSVRFYDS